MKILEQAVPVRDLKKMAETGFGDLVKAVVDVDREMIAIDAELYSDLESLLLENGSKQKFLSAAQKTPGLPGEECAYRIQQRITPKHAPKISKKFSSADARSHYWRGTTGMPVGFPWGINLYPELTGEDFVEFDSMISVRPNQGNRSRAWTILLSAKELSGSSRSGC